jgi:hypothetical protein
MQGIMGHASVMRLRFTSTKAIIFIYRPTPKNIFVSIGRRMSATFSTVYYISAV